jgi:hypothetical protein
MGFPSPSAQFRKSGSTRSNDMSTEFVKIANALLLVLGFAAIAYGSYQEKKEAAVTAPLIEKNRAVCFDFKGNLSLNIKENSIHYTTDGIEWGDEKGKYKLFVPSTGLLCSIVKEG